MLETTPRHYECVCYDILGFKQRRSPARIGENVARVFAKDLVESLLSVQVNLNSSDARGQDALLLAICPPSPLDCRE